MSAIAYTILVLLSPLILGPVERVVCTLVVLVGRYRYRYRFRYRYYRISCM